MSSDGARSMVTWLCPSCDAEPPAGLAEPVCPTCGARLIEVRSRAENLSGVVIDGRFEIRDLLGEGGMGAVYRAWQRSIGREVAIKLIDQRHSRDPMAVRRFLREARLASQLSQPNTVSVFDFGQAHDGRLFIAMELIRGRTLADVLEVEGPFSPARAAWIGVQLCDALDAAHRLHIVHRDLKPANIVLLDDPPGRDLIKVLDFGLAKSLTGEETHDTDTGLVVGTPRYMAPEIVMGEKPTPASDLYAVGVILGELTTGRTLWDATSFPALAGQKLKDSPVLGQIPRVLRDIVARLLSPDVGQRPARASEVRALLRPLVTSAETPLPATAAVTGRETEPTHAMPATPSPAPAAAAPTVALRPDPATPPPGSPGGSTGSAALPVRRPRLPLVLAGITAAAALITGALVIQHNNHNTQARVPDAAPAMALDAAAAPAIEIDAGPAAVPPDAAPAAETVVLHVASKPPGAEVQIDGEVRGTTPVDVTVPRASAAVVVEVVRAGKRARKVVVPDRDLTLTLILPREPRRDDQVPF